MNSPAPHGDPAGVAAWLSRIGGMMSAQLQTPNGNGNAPALAFNEAPASINTFVTSPAGFSYQLTMRGARVGDLLQQARTLESWLTENGWTPASKAQGKASQGDAANSVQGEPAPLCDKCGQPMKRRTTKDGTRSFWSCATKYGDGNWCQGKPKQ